MLLAVTVPNAETDSLAAYREAAIAAISEPLPSHNGVDLVSLEFCHDGNVVVTLNIYLNR